MKRANTKAAIRRRRCAYCGAPPPCTIDHFMPKALGGTNELSNLVAACKACNQRKGHMHPYDWLDLLQKERRGIVLCGTIVVPNVGCSVERETCDFKESS